MIPVVGLIKGRHLNLINVVGADKPWVMFFYCCVSIHQEDVVFMLRS